MASQGWIQGENPSLPESRLSSIVGKLLATSCGLGWGILLSVLSEPCPVLNEPTVLKDSHRSMGAFNGPGRYEPRRSPPKRGEEEKGKMKRDSGKRAEKVIAGESATARGKWRSGG